MSSPLYAVIDLGSNSFHMLITRQLANSVQVVDKVKRKVRLASGLNEDNVLNEDSIARGLECMRFFAERLQDFPPENIRIVATATLRLAKNRQTFIDQANQILGHSIQLLSGEEEAQTIYKGVAYTSNIQGNKLVFDIGGASTEIIIGENIEPIKAVSLNIGCVTFNLAYFPQGVLSKANFELAIEGAKAQIKEVVKAYQGITHQVVLGGSGTMQALAEILMHQQKPTLITMDFLQDIQQQLIQCQQISRIDIEGLSAERIPVFASGLAILIALFESFNVNILRLSAGALREGLLYDMMPAAQDVDIATLTINSMMAKYHVEQAHGQRVLSIATQLFAACQPNWSALQPNDFATIKAACLLHEVGLLIEFKKHQKHGAYIINHSQMLGFNQSEQQTLAMLIALQKDQISSTALSEQLFCKETCLAMLIIVRLAILLSSRRQDSHLPEMVIESTNNQLTLILEEHWLLAHPLIKDELTQEIEQLASLGFQLNVAAK